MDVLKENQVPLKLFHRQRVRFYLDELRIKSRQNMDNRIWTGLKYLKLRCWVPQTRIEKLYRPRRLQIWP